MWPFSYADIQSRMPGVIYASFVCFCYKFTAFCVDIFRMNCDEELNLAVI